MKTEKLQKALANLGLGSRREIEKWIAEGRIKVNRETAKLGDRVSENDRIWVNGKPIHRKHTPTKTRILIYHKPIGEVCTRHDPEGRPTVFEHLPKIHKGRWINIGRLDINTSGLLLFTNNGELANRLMHPGSQIEREYAVRILGTASDEVLKKMLAGVELEDGVARFESIQDAGGEGVNHWYHVVVKEGRNRLVRRLWESQGLTVSRLMRVRFGVIQMPSYLRRGKHHELTERELLKFNAEK